MKQPGDSKFIITTVFRKIAETALLLIILSLLVFALMYIAPGDPAEKRLTSQGTAITKEVLEAERARLGLMRPFLVRYGEWLFGIIRGDFGISFKDDMPVAPKLAAGLHKTLILSSGNSMPNFLISVLLMYVLCIQLRLFPVIADGSPASLILPVLSLSIPMSGRFIRQMRSEFIDQLNEDYVTGMRMRGVKERYVAVNIIRNSLGHILTIVGLQVGTLMGGSVVIETIFRWPGLGKLVMDSINSRDYPVIMGFVIIMGTIYIVINQLTDVSYHVLDPRV